MINAAYKAAAALTLTASIFIAGSQPAPADSIANATAPAFQDLNALFSLPTSCATTRSTPLRPTFSQDFRTRDPMTQRSVDLPICAAIRECANSLSNQLGQIHDFLTKHPRVVEELNVRTFRSSALSLRLEDVVTAMMRGRRALNAFHMLDGTSRSCQDVYFTIDSSVFPLSKGGTRMDGDRGLSVFLPVAQQMIEQWQADHAADNAWYSDWAPYVQAYPSATEIKRKFEDYNSAFNHSDADAFLSMRREIKAQRRSADAFRQTLIAQTETLAEIDDRLARMASRINSEVGILGGQDLTSSITALRAHVVAVRDTDPAKRGDTKDQIESLTGKMTEIDGTLSAIEVKIALLKSQDAHRVASLGSIRTAHEILSQKTVQSHLDPKAQTLSAQLAKISQQLNDLASIPVLQRTDSGTLLAAADAAAAQAITIQRDQRQIDGLNTRAQKLMQYAQMRGSQYIDEDTSKRLSTTVASFDNYSLPLSTADQANFNDKNNSIAALEKSLPALLDAGEMKVLSKQFPLTSGNWNLSVVNDKLTDTVTAQAQTAVRGQQALFQFKIACVINSPAVEISAYEPSSWWPTTWLAQKIDGRPEKPIWPPGVAVAPVQFRIDRDPAEPILFMRASRDNAGILVTDKLGRLLVSQQILLAGLFRDETIELKTAFPQEFVRLCGLMAKYQPH